MGLALFCLIWCGSNHLLLGSQSCPGKLSGSGLNLRMKLPLFAYSVENEFIFKRPAACSGNYKRIIALSASNKCNYLKKRKTLALSEPLTANFDNTEQCIALVTGANRGLGFAISQYLAMTGAKVIMTARDAQNGQRAANALRPKFDVHFCPLDVSCQSSIDDLVEYFRLNADLVPHFLFNNAAVCIEGRSTDVFRKTLRVNLFGAVNLSKSLVTMMIECRKSANIINISSGDGELSFLNSNLQLDFGEADSIEHITSIVQNILQQNLGASSELAFGPTPAYSVSKAALNAVTRVVGGNSTGFGVSDASSLRVISVCPGDVSTAMCTDPDNAISASEAAADVVWAALHAEACPSGGFYRHRERIGW